MGTGFSTTSRRKKKSSVTQKSPTQESTPTPIKIRSDQALVKEKFGDTVEGIGSPEIERIRRGEAGRVFEEQVRGADPGKDLQEQRTFKLILPLNSNKEERTYYLEQKVLNKKRF